MLHRAIAFGIGVVLIAEAADPPWKSVGTCFTPQGTLCRTVQWKSTGWENVSWGFHAIRRWSGTAVFAYSRNGATIERYAQQVFRNWVVRDSGWDRAQIRLPAEHRTIDIDHATKEYNVRTVVVGGSTVWNSQDQNCAKMASAFSLSDLRRKGESTIAGFRSIQYSGLRSKYEDESIWLAPVVGCSEVMEIRSSHNRFGLPTSYSRSEVISLRIGEPDKALFEIPNRYRLVH